jgi:hypothetical protein
LFRLIKIPRWDWGLWLTVGLCLFAWWPSLGSRQLAYGHDSIIHIQRVAEMSRAWDHGVLMPRWAEAFYYGYGSPLFQYYANTMYHLAALAMRVFGLDAPGAIRLIVMTAPLLSGAGMYLFARQRLGALAGVIAALCYVYSPYILFREPHVRGAYPEMLAFALFPFVMWRMERVLLAGRALDVLFAALAVGLLIITHNLMALTLFSLVAAWLCWGKLTQTLSWRRLGLGGLAAALGVGLAAYFWLPVMLERGEAHLNNLTAIPILDYRNAFVRFETLFDLAPRMDAAFEQGLLAHNSLGVTQWVLGLVAALAALIAAIQGYRKSRSLAAIPEWARYGLFYALLAVVLIFLMLPESEWLWDTIGVITVLQFPWRMLGPAAFALAVLGGMNATWIARLPARWGGVVLAGLIVAMVGQSTPMFYIADRWRTGPLDTSVAGFHALEMSDWFPAGGLVTNEFLPHAVLILPGPTTSLLDDYADGYPVMKANLATLPEGATLEFVEHGPQRDVWRVTTDTPFTLEVYTFYFAGWQAEIDGKRVPITPSEPHGLITFDVPAGEHTIRLTLKPTAVRRAGNMITILAAVGLIVVTGALWRQQRQVEAASSPDTDLLPAWGTGLLVGGIAAALLAAFLMQEGRAWVRSGPGEARLAAHHLDLRFGDSIQLVGYDLSDDEPGPGDLVTLVLYWYVRDRVDIDYNSFVHVSTGGPPQAQEDKYLPADARTSEWPPGAHLADEYLIRLPESIPPGEYRVTVGLWTCEGLPEGECGNGLRLEVADAAGNPVGDSAFLQTVRVH